MKSISLTHTLPLFLLFASGCGSKTSAPTPVDVAASVAAPKPAVPEPPPAGPILTDFGCSISAVSPSGPLSLVGTHPPIAVTVKHKGTETWMAMIEGRPGRNLVNIGYHWVAADGTETEGTRTGFNQDVKPGESRKVSLRLIEMPPSPGEYILRIEPIQEAVGWFSSKGGCKTELKVKLTP